MLKLQESKIEEAIVDTIFTTPTKAVPPLALNPVFDNIFDE